MKVSQIKGNSRLTKTCDRCCCHAPGEGNTSNPLKQVLNAVGEQVECAVYDRVSTLPVFRVQGW